jgi:hypothetical protein
MDLYVCLYVSMHVSMYVHATMRLLFVVVIVVDRLSHPISHILQMQTGIRNDDKDMYILLETINLRYVFVHKSSFLSLSLSIALVLSLKCWQSMKQNANSLSLALIYTYSHSIICTVSRIQTGMHLKHYSKKNDYYYVTFIFLCMISLTKLLFFAYQSFI